MSKKFYITTAIHYASGLPHIGHAYENILTPVIARYKRLIGFDVFFLTGMDVHGQKIAEKAISDKMEPLEWCSFIASKFLDLWSKLDISNDKFTSPTDGYHVSAVQKAFSEMYQKKLIY